jgi:phosphatidylserine/phosphatidylglycerophosphate/cardiolipin synthase-like enzyme
MSCFAKNDPITSYEIYFSEQTPLIERFISLINDEQKSIKLAAYCLRHNGIAKALIAAQKRGVFIEIIVDSFSVKSDSPIKKLTEKNICIYIWSPLNLEQISL